MGRALTQRHRDTEVAKVRLGEVCRIVGGGTPSKSKPEYYVGKIPWASVRDMKDKILSSTEYSISEIAVENSATNIIPKGEVIISTHVGLGKVSILAQDTAINQDLKAIIPTSLLLRGYLYHWFVSQANFIVTHGHGITVKGVSVDFIKVLEIPLPPLAEQKRIAGELDRICELKKNAEERLALMDQLVKSKFVEMFGDVLKKWDKQLLGDIAFITKLAGFEYTKYIKYQDHGDVIMIRGLNCKKTKLVLDDIYWIDRATSDLLPRSKLSKGDLVFTYVGTVGEVAVVDRDDTYHLAPNVAKIELNDKEKFNPYFFAYELMYLREYVLKFAASTTQAALSMDRIRKIPLPVPPSSLQREFAAFAESVDKSKAALKETIATMETLYKERLQEYFA